jgi:hypothetical protein
VVPESSIGGYEYAMIVMERGGKAAYMIFGSSLVAGNHNPAFDWQEVTTILLGVEAR